SHARGKQFLYDEGIRVPLIIRWRGFIKPGTVREDLVSHIDIAAGLYSSPVTNHGSISSLPGTAAMRLLTASDACEACATNTFAISILIGRTFNTTDIKTTSKLSRQCVHFLPRESSTWFRVVCWFRQDHPRSCMIWRMTHMR
ncbi:MAG: sulfatase/phosphatase domain-containing protein, partial [Planctomycetota bacterium]